MADDIAGEKPTYQLESAVADIGRHEKSSVETSRLLTGLGDVAALVGPREHARVDYYPDCVVLTVAIRLEFDQGSSATAETPAVPPRSAAWLRLKAAAAQYAAGIAGPETAGKIAILKSARPGGSNG